MDSGNENTFETKLLTENSATNRSGRERNRAPHSAQHLCTAPHCLPVNLPITSWWASLVLHPPVEVQRSDNCHRVRSTKDTLTPNPVFIHSLFQQLCLTRVWAPRIKPKLPFTKHSCVPGTVPGALHGVQMNIIPILPTGKLWLSEVKWHAQSYTAHR